jgi:hypothetical protein
MIFIFAMAFRSAMSLFKYTKYINVYTFLLDISSFQILQ